MRMRRNSRPRSKCINPEYSLNPSELSMSSLGNKRTIHCIVKC